MDAATAQLSNGPGPDTGSVPTGAADSVPKGTATFDVKPLAPSKRKNEDEGSAEDARNGFDNHHHQRQRGTAPVKAEYIVTAGSDGASAAATSGSGNDDQQVADDDSAEAFHHKDRQPSSNNSKKSKRRDRNQGQNKARKFGSSRDEVGLCSTRVKRNEFSPDQCPFGDKCKFEHDLRRYLKEHKRQDLDTFNSQCPVYEVRGRCAAGWKCRFVGSHSTEVEHEDGRKELVLIEDSTREPVQPNEALAEEVEAGVVNALNYADRIRLTKKNFATPKSDAYLKWILHSFQDAQQAADQQRQNGKGGEQQQQSALRNSSSPEPTNGEHDSASKADSRANYTESILRPSEKRRLYFGPETPVLAPLTTQGNLPFRRLCTSLGATFTYSEMAMSMPLLQGQKSEWALLKADQSETMPPTFTTNTTAATKSKSSTNIVFDYNQANDIRFGAQIAANKPWLACKATEALTSLLPQGLRCVDLNVGCPIDLVYREGAGSALMDSPHKLEKILRGMNTVSGPIPITVKIRTGTKDKQPTAQKLVDRLILGSPHNQGDPCGVAAITLHGRSRQQRYTRSADWEYIKSTAELIKSLNAKADALADTIREPDERDQANAHSSSSSSSNNNKKVFFLGNGDVYSHVHYYDHLEHSGVDAVMIGRGALIKPWIFEEISAGQHLDKSSSERLGYIEQFCRNGLEAWGSDEVGVGQTRRFLLEWLSFACRYVPVGLLEVLPPEIQDRPPRYRGRDDLETLMASDNYKDWIKISEMFLGPAHKDFRFEPKHKSNAYDAQVEG